MDDLKAATYKVRNGLPTDYSPKNLSERERLRYCQASFLVFSGEVDRFHALVQSEEWSSFVAPHLLAVKLVHYKNSPREHYQHPSRRILHEYLLNQPGLDPFWRIEVLSCLAVAASQVYRFDEANALLNEMYLLCREEGEHQKLSEAILNLASNKMNSGDQIAVRHWMRETEELYRLTSLRTYEVLLQEIQTMYYLMTDDAYRALEFFNARKDHSPFIPMPGNPVLCLLNCHETLLRRGWLREADQIAESIRVGFVENAMHSQTLALNEVRMKTALRLYDAELARLSIDSSLRETLSESRHILSAIVYASVVYRSLPTALDEARSVLNSVEPWLPSVRRHACTFEIARLGIELRAGRLRRVDAEEIIRNTRRLLKEGAEVDAKNLWFFGIETLMALGETEAALGELRAWTKFCKFSHFRFDQELGEALLALAEKQSIAAVDAASLKNRGREVAQNLLLQWPWRRRNSRDRLEPSSVELSGRHQKVDQLMQLLGSAGGRCVRTDAIVRELWGEEFDPLIHSNRVHQLVVSARKRLQKKGYANSSIKSVYGDGYSLVLRSGPAAAQPRAHELESRIVELVDEAKGEALSAQEIAPRVGISVRHARRILQKLVADHRLAKKLIGKMYCFASPKLKRSA